jgi:hypothetical protein
MVVAWWFVSPRWPPLLNNVAKSQCSITELEDLAAGHILQNVGAPDKYETSPSVDIPLCCIPERTNVKVAHQVCGWSDVWRKWAQPWPEP